jgi:hypothetical protein
VESCKKRSSLAEQSSAKASDFQCKVRAPKTLLGEDPSAQPVFSGYTVMESDVTDKLPDGNYDLLANGERIRFRRSGERFLSRP